MSSLSMRRKRQEWARKKKLGEDLKRAEEEDRKRRLEQDAFRDKENPGGRRSTTPTKSNDIDTRRRSSSIGKIDRKSEGSWRKTEEGRSPKDKDERQNPGGSRGKAARLRSSSNASENKRKESPKKTKQKTTPTSGWLTSTRKVGEKRQRREKDISCDSDSSSEAPRRRSKSSRRRGIVGAEDSPASSVSLSQLKTPEGQKMEMDSKKNDTPTLAQQISSQDTSVSKTNNNIIMSQDSIQSAAPPTEKSASKSRSPKKIKAPNFLFNFKKKKAELSSDNSSSGSDSDDDKATEKTKPKVDNSPQKKKKQSSYWGSSSDDSSSDEEEEKKKKATTPTKETEEEGGAEDTMEAKPSPAQQESEDEAPKSQSKPAHIANDDDDVWMDKPKENPKKRGLAKNPLAIQAREQMEALACQQKTFARTNNNTQDDLWDSDEEERAAQQQRLQRRRGRNASPAAAPVQVEEPPPAAQLSDEEGRGNGGAQQPVRGNDRANGSDRSSPKSQSRTPAKKKKGDSEDEEIEQQKRAQHPSLEDPTFGPFANEPLVLTNEDTGATDHQVPAALARYLPPFQRQGISFIYNAIINGRGAILGDDMGLGKTLQVISLLAALLGKTGTGVDDVTLKKRKKGATKLKKDNDDWKEQALLGQRSFKRQSEHMANEKNKLDLPAMAPILIVVPASVVDNWDFEFSMWGHFSVEVFREEKFRQEALDAIKYGSAEVLLCGHSMFQSASHIKSIMALSWKLVVIDEFHVFKNPKGKNSQNLRAIVAKSGCPVLGMTGTPMQNRYEELHNLIDLVHPDLLGSKKVFMNGIGNPIKAARSASATKEVQELGEAKLLELRGALQPIYIQRFKTEVLKGLPPKVEEVVLCELSKAQKQTYRHILNLPDYLCVRGARCPCDCGINVNYFAQYRRLRTKADKIRYQRNNKFVSRSRCCYRYPKEEDAILWRYQHPDGELCYNHAGAIRCPYCLLLPCLSKLYQLSSNLALLQYDRSDKSVEKKDREKRESFSKIAFPKEVQLPGGTERCDELIQSREQFFMMSGKFKKLHALLQQIDRKKGRVLLFSYSTLTLDLIQNYLISESYGFLRIDGSTPSKNRQKLVNEFQTNADHFCFLLSTRAAGVGLNLTAANNVIIFDAEWNPALDEQAQDRSWRIGQKRKVTVYRLISQGTIDEMKYLRQIYKGHLKKETFRRSTDEDDKTAAPRSFVGVEGDGSRRGELFGMENLLKFSEDSSFMLDVFKVDTKRKGLVAGKADEIARAMGSNAYSLWEKDTESDLREEIEKTAVKVLGKQRQETKLQSGPSTSQGDTEKEAYVKHADLFQSDKVQLAFDDPDDVMGGETQAVDDFVGRTSGGSDDLLDGIGDFGNRNDIDPLDDDSDDGNDGHGGTRNGALERDDDTSMAERNEGDGSARIRALESDDDTSRAESNEGDGRVRNGAHESNDDDASMAENNSPSRRPPKTPLKLLASRSNFQLCGVSALTIEKAYTPTFSKEDIFQPKKK